MKTTTLAAIIFSGALMLSSCGEHADHDHASEGVEKITKEASEAAEKAVNAIDETVNKIEETESELDQALEDLDL